MTEGAQPFLKWVGGKRQLLPEILEFVPRHIRTYFEPFVGGGAVFFELAKRNAFARAVVGDQNDELVDTYRAVQMHTAELVVKLREHEAHATDPDYFYGVRNVPPLWLKSMPLVDRAARTIFLNKTCFNGLYRRNLKGEFNASFGRYKNPTVCNEPRLIACARALRCVELVVGDFQDTVGLSPFWASLGLTPGEGDVVYFDPPYMPVSADSFVQYDSLRFGPQDHRRLLIAMHACVSRGATCVLSNSDCEFTRDLYTNGVPCRTPVDLEIHTVQARRAVNSDAEGRGPVNELLVVGRPG